jgi:hypothetical protein
MKRFAMAVLSFTVSFGSLSASEGKRTAIPGTDDISRYTAAKAAPGGQAILRNASGRTLGTTTTVGTRTDDLPGQRGTDYRHREP